MGIIYEDKPKQGKVILCYRCQFFRPEEVRCVLDLEVKEIRYCRSFISNDICNERNINGRENY